MKKILLTLACIFFSTINCNAINVDLDEVVLDDKVQKIDVSTGISEKETNVNPLTQKLRDVYNLEINNIDDVSYLFEDSLTKKFSEESALDSLHFWSAYNGYWNTAIQNNGQTTNRFDTNFIRVVLDGKMKNDNFDFRLMLGPNPNSSRNVFQELFQDVYIATNKIPHHRVKVGKFRPMIGIDGSTSGILLPFFQRSQIGANFGGIRKVGLDIHGDYKLAEYDIGGFNSDTYFQSFFPGAEFDGWLTLKPFGLTDGKYGNLRISGGLQAGHNNINYNVLSTAVEYSYKNFSAAFEWENANGYNGMSGRPVKDHASGYYVYAGYRITPKIQLVACYDQFDPDKNIGKNTNREYSVGINYFLKGQALKLVLNYIFCQNEATRNSHKILVGAQIII